MITLPTICNYCDLGSIPIKGRGNLKGNLCIIADRPNYEDYILQRGFEDLQDIYFRKILRENGFSKDYYITYLTKCYSQNKHTPKQEENYAKICNSYWLNREIKDFKFILLLGKTVHDVIYPRQNKNIFSSNCGKSIEDKGIMYWPWYTQAHLFRCGKALEKKTISLLYEIKKTINQRKINELEILEKE